MRRSKALPEFVQLLFIAIGYVAAIVTYRTFYPDNYMFLTSDEVALGFGVSVCSMWVAVKLLETGDPGSSWARMTDEFCVGTGINLILDALLNYFQILTRSIFLIVVGSAGAILLLGIGRWLASLRDDGYRPGILMIDFDPLAYRLASALRQPILGVLGPEERSPADVRRLGDYSQFDRVVEELRPTQIVVAGDGAAALLPSKLLEQRLHGVPVGETAGLYEKLLGRIYCLGWDPADMVLSESLSTNSRMLAIQAIYTNLIGMALLVVLSPVMLLTALVAAIFCGRGPVIEAGEYSGFQNIPFLLMRFRTHRRDGSACLAGSLIQRLRLDRLPQLFNVVRGEMSLFGPRPVRRQFAQRLIEMIPFYAMRFSVKPGILGWSQMKLRGETERACELTEFEYDLYYIKRGSPLLDLDILTAVLLGDKRVNLGPPEKVPAG